MGLRQVSTVYSRIFSEIGPIEPAQTLPPCFAPRCPKLYFMRATWATHATCATWSFFSTLLLPTHAYPPSSVFPSLSECLYP